MEPLFCSDNTGVENRTMFYQKNGLIMVLVIMIGITLNGNGIFMTFKRFKEKYDINTHYVTYTGCVQAVKSYIRDWTNSGGKWSDRVELTKTLPVTYSTRKGVKSLL